MGEVRTGPGRIILAVLAGAITAPLFVVLSLILGSLFFDQTSSSGKGGVSDALQTLLLLWGAGVIVGGPIALGAIVILFGPLWHIHSRLRRGPLSFMVLAGIAGFLLDRIFWLVDGASDPLDPKISWIFPLSATLSGGIMWLVAYLGAPRITDPRTLPQANFTGLEPATNQ